jgi:DNA-binding FrmR family transcriptional regulator|tara:strand:- start:280 stop:582 length:303 start_codon:yes stop_codon:yes gene_type:complete
MNDSKNTDCCQSGHPSHQNECKNLNRLSGQIEGIKKMIEERRYCPEIITQLRAIQAATKSIESNILERHLKSCVQDAFKSSSEESESKIEELIKIFKRYN